MSDNAQLLAWTVEPAEATTSAALVLAWLVKRSIVEAMPTDSGLGSLAHPPGPNVLEAVVPAPEGAFGDFRTLQTNGMDVEHGSRS